MDSANATADTRPYHHGNLREALIEAALEILERDGEDLTLRAAAKLAGVSHTAPYNHFADKEGLLAATAVRGFEKLTAAVEAARLSAGSDMGDQLVATAHAYVFFAAEQPALFRLMFGPRKANAEDVRMAGLAAFNALVEVMRDGMAAGTFRDGDPRSAAFAAWSLVHGMSQLAIDRTGPLSGEDRTGISDRLHAAHRIMMEGLQPR